MADSLFQEAVQKAKDGQYGEAIDKFQASYQLDPARGTLLGMAMAEERASRLADALGHYRQLLELATQAGDQPRVEAATQALTELDPRVPRLTVVVKGQLPEKLELMLNGRPLPRGAIGTPLPLNPGKTQLFATAEGYQPFAFAATLIEHERTTVELDLVAVPPPLSPPLPAQGEARWRAGQVGGLVLGGAGVALLAGGTCLWIRSGDTYADLSTACPNNACPESARSQVDSGREQERLARAALIFGGAALAAGATWFFVTRPERASSASVRLGVSAGAVRLGGTF